MHSLPRYLELTNALRVARAALVLGILGAPSFGWAQAAPAPAAVGSTVTGTAVAAGDVEAIGRVIFTDYLLPFELTSVLLLAAMVGVLLLARRRA